MKVDQFISWHASILPSGDVVRCDRRGNVAPSEIARARLRFIVRADREACPASRWVRRVNGFGREVFAIPSFKPVFRLERRR